MRNVRGKENNYAAQHSNCGPHGNPNKAKNAMNETKKHIGPFKKFAKVSMCVGQNAPYKNKNPRQHYCGPEKFRMVLAKTILNFSGPQ